MVVGKYVGEHVFYEKNGHQHLKSVFNQHRYMYDRYMYDRYMYDRYMYDRYMYDRAEDSFFSIIVTLFKILCEQTSTKGSKDRSKIFFSCLGKKW